MRPRSRRLSRSSRIRRATPAEQLPDIPELLRGRLAQHASDVRQILQPARLEFHQDQVRQRHDRKHGLVPIPLGRLQGFLGPGIVQLQHIEAPSFRGNPGGSRDRQLPFIPEAGRLQPPSGLRPVRSPDGNVQSPGCPLRHIIAGRHGANDRPQDRIENRAQVRKAGQRRPPGEELPPAPGPRPGAPEGHPD